MFGSQFDGNAAFSGGGFMPSQATQTADTSFSSAKSRDTQPLLPLTVKQIREALQSNDDKSNFFIDGVDVNNVTLVGIVCNKAERVTDVTFGIDDGTGRIACNRWVHEAVDMKEMEGISNGIYARVNGQLKGFQGKKQLMVFSIRPVTDYNEIACHFVECMYVHLHNTKFRKLEGTVPTSAHMPNSAVGTPLKGYQVNPSNQFTECNNVDGLHGIEKMVIGYLQQPSCLSREKGVHWNEVAQQLKLPVDKIQASIRVLEEEGLVYSTIDECHYKSTVNG